MGSWPPGLGCVSEPEEEDCPHHSVPIAGGGMHGAGLETGRGPKEVCPFSTQKEVSGTCHGAAS